MSRARRLSLRRLRPRLTATLAVVAALTAIAVAAASYGVVRSVRLDRATTDAVQQSRFNLFFAADALPPDATTAEVEGLLRSLQRRGGFDTVITTDRQDFQSSVSLGPAAVPEDLARSVSAGRIVAARRSVAGSPQVVVGGALQPDGPTLWFFYPLASVDDDLRTLGLVLAGSAGVMVLLSAAVGVVAAGGLLRPIARARDAARRVERGDLLVRLDEDGSDEFAELSRSFNAMSVALERTVTELRQSDERQRRFVSDVSHELRTPITALAAAADVIAPRLDRLDGVERRAAQILVNEASRLRLLVEDLMEISRVDAGVAVLDRTVVDLADLLAAIADQPAFRGSVSVDLDEVSIDGDRRRLHRVFANLVDNGLRHGRAPIEVRLARDGDRAVVVVDDCGPGIPPEDRPHVFDRFFKGDQARQRTASSGLGLAIAREDVLLHGGSIEVDERPGGGARFRVVLPAAVAHPLRSGEPAVTRSFEPGGGTTTSSKGTTP